jgi:hypothetical protein
MKEIKDRLALKESLHLLNSCDRPLSLKAAHYLGMSVSRRGSSLLMPMIESCRLMPWTREETQSSSTKEKENRKLKLPFTEFLGWYSHSCPSQQGGGSGSG